MKARLKIKQINTILSIFGLAALLLSSPCKVRNLIQAELGIPQTKVLNKSKATIAPSSCQAFAASRAVQTLSVQEVLQPDSPIQEAYHSKIAIHSAQYLCTRKALNGQLIYDVPLYILYHSMLLYS